MTLLYTAAGLLVLAQLLGIYALVSRKADFIFSLMMLALLGGALACGVIVLTRHLG